MAYTFEELGVTTSLHFFGSAWQPLHVVRNVVNVEAELGRPHPRGRYNERMSARARRERGPVLGQHAGFNDLFVPVRGPGGVEAILVIGPFLVAPLASATIERQWLDLSGTPARLTDAAFAAYLSLALDTLTVEGRRADVMIELATHFADLLAERGDPAALAERAAVLRQELAPLRFPERSWAFVEHLLENRPRGGPLDHGDQAAFGLHRTPQNVVVGHLAGARAQSSPLDDVLRRTRFQRTLVDLAKERGRWVAGRLGRQGVVLLADPPHGEMRAQSFMRDFVGRAGAVARGLGLTLHAGFGFAANAGSLQNAYRVALHAAEKALAEKKAIVVGEALPESTAERLRELRTQLALSAGDTPDVVASRFHRYVDAVVTRSGQDSESVRAQLDVALEQLVEPLIHAGVLDRKSAGEIYEVAANGSVAGQSTLELTSAHRRAITVLEASLADPTNGRRRRGLGRAIEFVRDHLESPITLPQVARAAGFAPEYFSRLFKQEFGMPFARHRQQLRVEKSRILLAETTLSVEQIQRLCGFRSRAHFHTTFKREVGRTPAAYRASED